MVENDWCISPKESYQYDGSFELGPSINGLVTDANTKLCCRGFISALFQSTTVNKIDSENTRDYKRLLPVCEAEILQVTEKELNFSLFFMLISGDFRLKVRKIAKKVPRFLAYVHKDG